MTDPTLQAFTDQFPTDPTGLAACHASEVVDLSTASVRAARSPR